MLDSHLLTSSHCGTGFIRSIFPGRACAGHCTAHHPMPCGQLATAAAISSMVGLGQDLILGHSRVAAGCRPEGMLDRLALRVPRRLSFGRIRASPDYWADAVAGHSGRPRGGSPRLTPRTIRLWSNDETPSRPSPTGDSPREPTGSFGAPRSASNG